MGSFLDWLTGRGRAQQEADAESTRQAAREAQGHSLGGPARQMPQKPPEAIQRAKNEPRPGERLMPDQVQRMRQAHDNPPEPKKPIQEVEATRMAYTMTVQLAPSIGGPGMSFKNSRAHVQQPTRADKSIDQSRAEIGQLDAKDRALAMLDAMQAARQSGPGVDKGPTAAEMMRRAEAANPTPREEYKPEDRIAAWRKNMTPDEQAAFDEARRQAQKQGQSQKPGTSLTEKQDV